MWSFGISSMSWTVKRFRNHGPSVDLAWPSLFSLEIGRCSRADRPATEAPHHTPDVRSRFRYKRIPKNINNNKRNVTFRFSLESTATLPSCMFWQSSSSRSWLTDPGLLLVFYDHSFVEFWCELGRLERPRLRSQQHQQMDLKVDEIER